MDESKTLLIAALGLAAYLPSSSLPSSAHCGEGAEKNLRKACGVKKPALFDPARTYMYLHHVIHVWFDRMYVRCDTYQPSLFAAADLITYNMHAQASTVQ